MSHSPPCIGSVPNSFDRTDLVADRNAILVGRADVAPKLLSLLHECRKVACRHQRRLIDDLKTSDRFDSTRVLIGQSTIERAGIVEQHLQRDILSMKEDMITVLIVEDEVIVRMDIADALENAGYRVLEAGSADEAISILNECGDIRVLFTDIDMPGSMDGLKLAAAVRDRWPPIGIIVTSGHRHMSDDKLPVEGRFFGKPYQPNHIINAVRKMTVLQ